MSKEKFYDVPVKFVFEGKFRIKAESRKEANLQAENNCHMTLSGGIESVLDDDEIDWDFPCHPKKIVRKR